MKRFLLKVFFATIFALLVAVSVIALRIALAQKAVDVAFDVPPGTEVIFIGNSHTGCSWTEAPEFRDRKVWNHSMGFPIHYVRFLELERRGAFDRGVKTCVVDCDKTSLAGFKTQVIYENMLTSLPFAWRHLTALPLPLREVVVEIFSHASWDFSIAGEPPEDDHVWTELPEARQKAFFAHNYGASWQTPAAWDSVAYPVDWQTRFYEMVADMKARCDRHGVRLILFASPLASQDPGRSIPGIAQRISDVAARVREMGVEYYDYRTACPDDQFRDAGHLLRRSAYEFTKKFYEEVLKLPVGELRSIE